MTDSGENPFASPQTSAITVEASNTDGPTWFQTSTLRGLRLGAFIGALLSILHLLRLLILDSDSVWLILYLPLTMLVWGLVFAFFGAVSGMIVGLVAMSVRDWNARSVAHFISCAIVPPIVFAGPLWLFAYLVDGLFYPVVAFAIMVLVGCGMIMGLSLFSSLRALEDAMLLRPTSTPDERDIDAAG